MAEQQQVADPGIEVTVKDLKTGESETAVIQDDYVLIVAGACWLDGIQDFPRAGTRVLTVKGRGGRRSAKEADRG